MRVFLCEKPSQGKDIARVLGAVQRGNGCYSGAGVVVTWCIGHLVEAVPPEGYGEQYKRWAIEQLPILPERWRVEPKAATAAQFKVVQQLVAKAGEMVIATDADREGEMIAREIIDLCDYRGPIQRLWLSALNDASIRKALGALKPSAETLPLYLSALARSRADWLIGMNLSRLFTLLGRQAVLGRGCAAIPCRPILHRELDTARRQHGCSGSLPSAAGGAAGCGSHSRGTRCAGRVGGHRARARGTAAAVRPGHAAGDVLQAVGPRRAGDAGHCPGAVRDTQGDNVSALGFGLPTREHAGRGADRTRQPGQDRPRPAAADRAPGSPTALGCMERRQGVGSPRHHPDAGARQPVGHEREGTGRLPADPRPLPRAVPPAP